MLRRFGNFKRVGLLAAVLSAGAMLTPASIFAAERGHDRGHDQRRVVMQHVDRGRHFDRDHVRVERGIDRGHTAFFGGVVVNPAPVYVPTPGYGYYTTPSPYAYPAAPDCNTTPYGY